MKDRKLQEFLDYLDKGILSDDPYIQALDLAVKKASQNAKWMEEYVMISLRDMYMQKASMEKGRQYERFQMLCAAARRGMNDDQLKTFLDATTEEINAVKEELSN